VKYYNSAGINAAEAAWHSRAHSQSVAESKKNSVDRDQLDVLGDTIGKDIAEMTRDQATRRVNFHTFTNPTYKFETSNDTNATLYQNGGEIGRAYPISEIFETEEFIAHVKDPLNPTKHKTAKDNYLTFEASGSVYHIPVGWPGYVEQARLEQATKSPLP